jgi:hypothetical protein
MTSHDQLGPQPSWWNMAIPFIIIITAIALAYLGVL